MGFLLSSGCFTMLLNGMVIRTKPANAFGRWLLDRFIDRGWESYRQAAEYTKISHTQLRSYVQGVVPRPPQLDRMATFFGVDRAFLEDLLGLAAPAHGSYAFLDRSLSSRSDSGFGMLDPDSARFRRAVEAAAGGALRLLRGDPPESVTEYLRSFEDAVDADIDAEREGRDGGPSGGPEGAGDPA